MKTKTLILAFVFFTFALSFANAGEDAGEKVSKSYDKMFSQVDTDANGSISTEEATATKYKFVSIRFEKIDTDSSNSIDLKEFNAEMNKRKAAKDKKKAAAK